MKHTFTKTSLHCHKCGERLMSKQRATPTGRHDYFKMKYKCPNGHTGTIEGQPGLDQSQWAKRGAVFGPKARSDKKV